GTVRTSVTLLGQDMGNTLLLIVYTSFVSSVVLFGRISARIKLLAERSIWPRSSRPNQTSITFCVIGLSPTDQPAKLVLRKSLWPSTLINPCWHTRQCTSADTPDPRVCHHISCAKERRAPRGNACPRLRAAAQN